MRLVSALCLAATLCLPFTATAKDAALMARFMAGRPGYTSPPCVDGLSTTATININFNGQADSLDKARTAFDTQKKEMEIESEKFGSDKVQLSNYNYSVSMNTNYNNGGQAQNFNFSGNLSYQVMGEDVATKISTRLSELHRQFTMNVSANRCQNPGASD